MTHRPKILAVDDKRENLVALRVALADLDVDIVEAGNGNDALLAASLTDDFALAVVDVDMPAMDGYELAGLLRRDPKTSRLPILFLTADLGEEERSFEGYEAGAVDYIAKPFAPVILRSKIEVFLELCRRARAVTEKAIALALSEERLQSLIMTVPDVVYRIDPAGRFTFLNDAVSFLGYEPQELIGQHFSAIMTPESAAKVSRDWILPAYSERETGPEGAPKLFDERRNHDRKTSDLEVTLVPKQGSGTVPGLVRSVGEHSVVAEVNCSGVYGRPTGRGPAVFLGTVGTIRDISEQKRTQRKLELYREHLEDLVAARVREQACLYGLSKVITAPFDSVPQLLKSGLELIPAGWQHADVACARLSLDDASFATRSFRETHWRLAEELLVAGKPRGCVEVFYTEERPEADMGPFVHEERDLIATIARILCQAIERHESETALRESEARVRKLLDASPDALFVTGPDGRFLDVNPAAVARYGYTAEELLSMTPKDLAAPSVAIRAQERVARPPDKRAQFEWTQVTKDGREIDVEINASPFVLDGKACVISIVRDITERRRMEEERRQLHEQATQSQRLESIGALASSVAHEINTPLNIVMNYAELIQEETATTDAANDYAATIVHETERMATIVSNLLGFSRQGSETRRAADVATIIDNTIGLLRSSFRKSQIELVTLVPDTLPKVHCLSQQIQQVLMNLLTNARDAINARSSASSPEKVIRIIAKAIDREDNPWVRISVEDRGGGVAPEALERMFHPFFTTKPKELGTGLGLSISHEIIQNHGGKLWCENQPGVGAHFHVELKVGAAASVSEEAS